jgi:hypothetical protein
MDCVNGDPKEIMQLLGVDSGGKINTAYIERLNHTICNSLARFIRKSMNCSKVLGRNTHALDPTSRRYDFPKNNFSRNGILQNVVPRNVFRITYLNGHFLRAIGKKRIFLYLRTSALFSEFFVRIIDIKLRIFKNPYCGMWGITLSSLTSYFG